METVIKPKSSWLHIDWQELIQYKGLFYFLAWRDIKVRYKQTVIGVLWAFFVPFVSMLIFTFFFSKAIDTGSAHIPYPLFVYIGLIFWTFFSQALSNSSSSLVQDQEMIKKVYFPRLLLPASTIFVAVIDFLIATLILVGMMIYFGYQPSWTTLWLFPLLIILTYITSLGLGLFLAAVNVQYRDVRYVIPFFIQMLLFMTPVIYPTSLVGEKYAWILQLNPMAGVIENARAAILGYTPINWHSLLIACGVSIVMLLVGLIYFRKIERYFADVI